MVVLYRRLKFFKNSKRRIDIYALRLQSVQVMLLNEEDTYTTGQNAGVEYTEYREELLGYDDHL